MTIRGRPSICYPACAAGGILPRDVKLKGVHLVNRGFLPSMMRRPPPAPPSGAGGGLEITFERARNVNQGRATEKGRRIPNVGELARN